jgi:hypothetical protein
MEKIMKLIEYAGKGSIMNIKENYYIYKFKQLENLIEEQRSTKDNDSHPQKRHREQGYKYPTQHTQLQCLIMQ